MSRLISKSWVRLPVLGGLLLATTVGAKNNVERPLTARADSVVVVDLLDGSFEATGLGVGAHGGRFSDVVTGYIDLSGGGMVIVYAAGNITVANGDHAWYEATGFNGHWTGGTGRFADLKGDFVFTVSTPEVTIDFETLTATITYSYTVDGGILY